MFIYLARANEWLSFRVPRLTRSLKCLSSHASPAVNCAAENSPERCCRSHRAPVSARGSAAFAERHSKGTFFPLLLPPPPLPLSLSLNTARPSPRLSQAGKTRRTSKSSLSRSNRIRHQRIPQRGPSPRKKNSLFCHFREVSSPRGSAGVYLVDMNQFTHRRAVGRMVFSQPRRVSRPENSQSTQRGADEVFLCVSKVHVSLGKFKQSAGDSGKYVESANQQQRDTVGTLIRTSREFGILQPSEMLACMRH